MKSLPKYDALALLAAPTVLEGPLQFSPSRNRPWHHIIEQGLLQPDGTRAGLLAKLEYSITKTTHLRTVQCSVFQAQLGGPVRVYQLTVTSSKRPIKDLHSLSHEHIGDYRSPGQAAWGAWSFEQTLAYFCQQTNITITDPIDHPETLRLR